MRCALGLLILGIVVGQLGPAAPGGAAEHHTLLVEAEAFAQRGGWVVDQQFMDQMGSPMLLAHGLGEPVADATTTVTLPAAGAYRVWVRTRDWAATWKSPEPPGKFQLLLDGRPLPETFGTRRAEWHWQDGGRVELQGPRVTLALHDLTGFDGRCDAIVLTTDPAFAPPNQGEAMAAWRRMLLGLPAEPEDAGPFDLVVVGGGIAGTCAAISAARLGLNVALIHDRPVLGGNNSSEVRVHLGGGIFQSPYRGLGGVVAQIGPGHGGNAQPPEVYEDDKKFQVAAVEKSLKLFVNMHACKVEKQGNRIAAVVARHIETAKELRFAAPLFADCTGDGTVGFLAGADFRYGRESRAETDEPLAPEKPDRQTMGASVMWYSAATDEPTEFPETPWAVTFDAKTYQKALAGNWNWETGFRLDQIEEAERVRDHGLRAVFGNWSFQKNHAPDKAYYAQRKLAWVAYVAGKRESRRLLGDVILRQQDIEQGREFPDASVTTTWTIDLHYPIQSDAFPDAEFRSKAEHVKIKPYPIPYRCLYSRNVDNLFMAGRNISVTHVALGTVRVMRTTGMMGELVGMAAAVSKRHGATPREVQAKYFDELKELMQRGVGAAPPAAAAVAAPPPWLDRAGTNLARVAAVHVSGRHGSKQYPPEMVNDGRVELLNKLRFVSDDQLPHTVELQWQQPQKFNAVRIVSGQQGSPRPSTPITDFVLQQHDGKDWKDIAGTKTTENQLYDWHATFDAVETARLRLLVTSSPGNLTRIWEIEAYQLPPQARSARPQ